MSLPPNPPSSVVATPSLPTPNVQWPAVSTTVGLISVPEQLNHPAGIREPGVGVVGHVEEQLPDVRVAVAVQLAVGDRADRRRDGERTDDAGEQREAATSRGDACSSSSDGVAVDGLSPVVGAGVNERYESVCKPRGFAPGARASRGRIAAAGRSRSLSVESGEPHDRRRAPREIPMTDTLIPTRRAPRRDRPPPAADPDVHRRRVPRRRDGAPLHDREPGDRAAARRGRAGRAGRRRRGGGGGAPGRRRRALVPAQPGRPQADPRPLGGPDRGQRARRSASSRRSTPASRSPTRSASTSPRPRPASAGTPRPPTSCTARSRPSPEGTIATITREPCGVVGAVIPWNYPAQMAAWKLGPALATGNTVVIKPASTTSLSLLRIAELGRPRPGSPTACSTWSPGPGDSVGEAIGRHPDIDCVAFTGSTEVGPAVPAPTRRRRNLKRVLLELGGKSPQLVFPDVDGLRVDRRQRRGRDLLEHGRELQRGLAADRPSLGARAGCSRRVAGGARQLAGRRPARPGDPHRRADQPRPHGARPRATSTSGAARAPAS